MTLKSGTDDHGCSQKFSLREEGGAHPKKAPITKQKAPPPPMERKVATPPPEERETSNKKPPPPYFGVFSSGGGGGRASTLTHILAENAENSCLYNRFALNFTRTRFFVFFLSHSFMNLCLKLTAAIQIAVISNGEFG